MQPGDSSGAAQPEMVLIIYRFVSGRHYHT